jgi:hypothetical protein
MEAVEVNAEIQSLILKNAGEEAIQEAARRNGFISMKEDAIIKALEHTIPFEEISTLGGDLLISDESEKEAAELKKPTEATVPPEDVVETSVDNHIVPPINVV